MLLGVFLCVGGQQLKLPDRLSLLGRSRSSPGRGCAREVPVPISVGFARELVILVDGEMRGAGFSTPVCRADDAARAVPPVRSEFAGTCCPSLRYDDATPGFRREEEGSRETGPRGEGSVGGGGPLPALRVGARGSLRHGLEGGLSDSLSPVRVARSAPRTLCSRHRTSRARCISGTMRSKHDALQSRYPRRTARHDRNGMRAVRSARCGFGSKAGFAATSVCFGVCLSQVNGVLLGDIVTMPGGSRPLPMGSLRRAITPRAPRLLHTSGHASQHE